MLIYLNIEDHVLQMWQMIHPHSYGSVFTDLLSRVTSRILFRFDAQSA
jgi:hypothetical protein